MKTNTTSSYEDRLLKKLRKYAEAFVPDERSPAVKIQKTRYNAITDMITYIEDYFEEERKGASNE